MAISTERFEFALDNVASHQWAQFEKLASIYFASEWPRKYRTVAAASGDMGRDGEIFSPESDPNVLLQFSVAKDWAAKILLTIKRINEAQLRPLVLVYATNRKIGAAGDDYKAKCLEAGFRLDIRDRSYFLERLHTTAARQEGAGEFSKSIADPILGSANVTGKSISALGANETKVAVVFIAMQLEDDKRDKGLTKISYEALVRSVMQETNAENRIGREVIVERVMKLLPAHSASKVENLILGAIERLVDRGIVKSKGSEYSLSFEEQEKIKDYTARTLLREATFAAEVKTVCEDIGIPSQKFDRIVDFVRRVLGVMSFKKGEHFAQAVANSNQDMPVDPYDIGDAMLAEISNHKNEFTAKEIDGIAIAIRRLIDTPSPSTMGYLKSLSNSYTLLAFLREVPDVQKVTSKLFSHGEIWLDTSVILPLLSEDVVLERLRIFRNIISAARDCGIKLFITSGVLEELDSHISKCISYSRTQPGQWKGPVPFLFAVHSLSGQPRNRFNGWIEKFRGDYRPQEDLLDFLSTTFGIRLRDLAEEEARTPPEVRYAIQELWREIHEERRGKEEDAFDLIKMRLVAHDVENYLGIIQRRKAETEVHTFGYSSWWLTLDKHARGMISKVRQLDGMRNVGQPVMSIDFLLKYLELGPSRHLIRSENEVSIPPFISIASTMENYTEDLLVTADAIRRDSLNVDEIVIRRRIRDGLDQIRIKYGDMHEGGLDAVKKAAAQSKD